MRAAVRQRQGKQYACTIDLRKALEHPETDSFALEPYDVVYVPRTKIARVDQFVQQYLSDIVPRWVTTGYNWNKVIDGEDSVTSGASGRVGPVRYVALAWASTSNPATSPAWS